MDKYGKHEHYFCIGKIYGTHYKQQENPSRDHGQQLETLTPFSTLKTRKVANHQQANGGFKKLVNNNSWIDMGFEGSAYTWRNQRKGCANIQERLDPAFANAEWNLQFPNA